MRKILNTKIGLDNSPQRDVFQAKADTAMLYTIAKSLSTLSGIVSACLTLAQLYTPARVLDVIH